MTHQRLVLALLLTACVGCAPSLQAARDAGNEQRGATAAAPSSDRCNSLSRTESALRYVSVGAAVLGGGSGIATIPTDDGAQTGLAITAAGFAVVAGTTEAVRAEVAADWARECK